MPAAFSCSEPIDEVDDVEEARASMGLDRLNRQRQPEMALAGAGSADQDDVAGLLGEAALVQRADLLLVDRRLGKVEAGEFAILGELGAGHLIANRASVALAIFRRQQPPQHVRRMLKVRVDRSHDRAARHLPSANYRACQAALVAPPHHA